MDRPISTIVSFYICFVVGSCHISIAATGKCLPISQCQGQVQAFSDSDWALKSLYRSLTRGQPHALQYLQTVALLQGANLMHFSICEPQPSCKRPEHLLQYLLPNQSLLTWGPSMHCSIFYKARAPMLDVGRKHLLAPFQFYSLNNCHACLLVICDYKICLEWTMNVVSFHGWYLCLRNSTASWCVLLRELVLLHIIIISVIKWNKKIKWIRWQVNIANT